MRLYFCLLIVCLFAGISTWAQSNPKIDSLERVIKTTKSDTTRGRTLCRLCTMSAYAGQNRNTLDSALKGLRILESRNDKIGLGECLLDMGTYYGQRGDFPKAIDSYQKSRSNFEQIGETRGVANCYLGLGIIYDQQGKHPKALDSFHRSLRLFEKVANPYGIVAALHSIGNIYKEQKKLDAALDYYQKGIQVAQKNNKKELEAAFWGSSATIYSKKKDYSKSIEYHQKAYDAFEKFGDLYGMGNAMNNISHLFLINKEFNKSLLLAHKALELHKRMDNKEFICSAHYILSLNYLYLQKTNVAKEHATHSLELAKKINHMIHIKEGLMANYLCDSAMGSYQDAFNYYKLYHQYSDSLTNEDKAREMGRVEAQYEHEKQREKEALLEAERRIRTNYTYSIVIGIVVVSAGFFFYRYRAKEKLNRALQTINDELAFKNEEIVTQRDELTIRNEEITTQRDELAAQADQLADQRDELDQAYHQLQELDEFKEAMSGMIVHDLKNPLSAIIGLSEKVILTPKDQVAIRQAGKQMLNLTLNILDVQKFEQTEVPLHLNDEALLNIVQEAIEQVSLLITNKNLQLSITIQPDTGVFCDAELMTRVLMNLLTNAIKYTPNNGKITISAEEMPDNQVKVSVADTGQGIPTDKLETVFDKFSQVEAKKSGGARSTGLGLTFCKMTVEAHGGLIGVESEVGIGTTFYFTLAGSLQAVKALQPIILPINEAPEINLTEEEKTLLQPFLKKLRALDVYEAGDVLKIIAQIPDSPEISVWKSEMERTIFASNQERFSELITN